MRAILAAITLAAGLLTAPATASAQVACTTTDVSYNCGPYTYPQNTASNGSNTYTSIDGWNCGTPPGCGPTSLTSDSPGDFTVTTTLTAGNTAVMMYPSNEQLLGSQPLSAMTLVRSGFTQSMPTTAGTVAHAAYDIWLDNWNTEIMIDTDNVNWGTAGSTYIGAATFAGLKYTAWSYGSELIWRLTSDGGQETSGTVHILDMLRWLAARGYFSLSSTLTDVSFGWEVCTTGGQPETFTVSGYWLHTTPADGS